MANDGLTVLCTNKSLISDSDINFMQQHRGNFENRFATRSLFRSNYEMEHSVLKDSVLPTVDAKYWQAIGEQAVHVQALIDLNFENKKTFNEIKAIELDIEEAKENISFAKSQIGVSGCVDAKQLRELSKLELSLSELENERDRKRFHSTLQQKTAQERLREIKEWEKIINRLHSQLVHGDQDFQVHHAEKYNILNGGSSRGANQINYDTKDDVDDPVAKIILNKNTEKILIGSLHRTKECTNATNFSKIQFPAAMSVVMEQPYGFSVADGRNFVVKKALDSGFDYIFFVDDDVVIPSNALCVLMDHIKNGYDMAGGFYYRKYHPLESCSMMEKAGRPARVDFTKGELIENPIVLCSGCTLIKTDVFKKIEYPWYRTVEIGGKIQITEDTYFGQQFSCVDGLTSVLDTSVQCAHVDKEHDMIYYHGQKY